MRRTGSKNAPSSSLERGSTSPTFTSFWNIFGSWLVAKFPERFRPKAASYDWWQAATDEFGRYLGKDRRPLKWRCYLDGEMLPIGYRFPWETNPPKPIPSIEEQEAILNRLSPEDMKEIFEDRSSAMHFQWKYDREIAGVTDLMDEVDLLDYQRTRAEEHAKACILVAELLEGVPAGVNSTAQIETEIKRLSLKPMCVKELIEALGCSDESLGSYAEAVGVTRPGRGKRNFSFPAPDVYRLICYASTNAGEQTIRKKANAILKKPTENPK